MTINNKSERNYRGKCLGWPVTSYGADGAYGFGPLLFGQIEYYSRPPSSRTVM